MENHIEFTFIPYVDAAIKRYVGYDVEQATYTETFDGNEQQDIFLRHVPVASITSVTEDGNTLTQGNEEDYANCYDNEELRRITIRWSGIKPKNISVTYVGGYAAADTNNIKLASARAAARLLMTSLQTSAKADTGQVSTHLADNTGTTNYDVALSEGGDYDTKRF